MKKLSKGFANPLILIAIGLIVGAGITFAYFQTRSNSPSQSTSTTNSTTIDETSNWKTYTSHEGKYSFKYPDSTKMYINEKFSVDGVKVPLKNTVVLVSDTIPQVNTNYQLSINHKITSETKLNDFIDNNSSCELIKSSKTKSFTLSGQQAAIFESTPCGPYGMTVIYALNNGVGYIIEIETHANYKDISKFIEPILLTFKFLN